MLNELDSHKTQIKDVFFRNATIAVLDMLNEKVFIEQAVNGEIALHPVPFFYSFGNDENFMRDFFIGIPHECHIPDHAEGNFETWPKGILLLTGFKVKPNEITNKFVRGTYRKATEDDNGEMSYKAMSAYLFALPLQLMFNVEVHSKTLNQAFRITGGLLEEFYKQTVANFQFKGNMIRGQFQMDDEVTNDKKMEFVYNDDKTVTTKMNIQFETFYPIFDTSTEMDKGKRIRQFNENIRMDIAPDSFVGPTVDVVQVPKVMAQTVIPTPPASQEDRGIYSPTYDPLP